MTITILYVILVICTCALLCVGGAVTGGFLAGLILAPLTYWLANWLFRRFGEIEVPTPFPAVWLERLSKLGASALSRPAPQAPDKVVDRP